MENKKDVLDKLNEPYEQVEQSHVETQIETQVERSEEVNRNETKVKISNWQSLETKEPGAKVVEDTENSSQERKKENSSSDQNFNEVERVKIKVTENTNKSVEESVDFSLIKTFDEYSDLAKNFYAGFWLRFIAYMIDLVAVLIITSLFNTLTFNKLNILEMPLIDGSLSTTIVYLSYFVLLTYFFGQTLGKMIVGVRVEGIKSSKATFFEVLFREIIGRLLTIGLFQLPYLTMFFNNKRRTLADYIGETVVVKEQYSAIRGQMNSNIEKSLKNKAKA